MTNEELNIPSENIEQEKKAQRQRDKIVYYMTYGNKTPEGNYVLSENNVELQKNDERDFLKKIQDGAIGDNEFKTLLSEIAPPIKNGRNTPEEVFSKIENNDKAKRILAQFTTGNEALSDRVGQYDLRRFVDTFPEPISFNPKADEFLSKIPEQQIELYKIGMSDLKKAVFGKQMEYYNQIQYLKDKAMNEDPRNLEATVGGRIGSDNPLWPEKSSDSSQAQVLGLQPNPNNGLWDMEKGPQDNRQ